MLGRWWEIVPSLGFIFFLALCGDARAEHFHGLQPVCHAAKDARKTRVVLWDSLGWRGKVGFGPPGETDARAFSRTKIKWRHSDSR